MREITSRQTTIQVIGPSGKVEVGRFDEFSEAGGALKTIENEHLDGSVSVLSDGHGAFRCSGRIAEYDGILARTCDEALHPGSTDPIRHIIVYSETYNDGTAQTVVYTGCLLQVNGKTVARGAAVSNQVEIIAEDRQLA